MEMSCAYLFMQRTRYHLNVDVFIMGYVENDDVRCKPRIVLVSRFFGSYLIHCNPVFDGTRLLDLVTSPIQRRQNEN